MQKEMYNKGYRDGYSDAVAKKKRLHTDEYNRSKPYRIGYDSGCEEGMFDNMARC